MLTTWVYPHLPSTQYHRYIKFPLLWVCTSNGMSPGGGRNQVGPRAVLTGLPAPLPLPCSAVSPAPHPQDQPSAHYQACFCTAEPFLRVPALNRFSSTAQFRNKTQGCIRQFIKPSHSQKHRNWYLQSTKNLPSGTSFFRFLQRSP